MSENIKTFDVNDWIDNFSAFMADETLKIMKAQADKRGPEVFKSLASRCLARVLTASIYEVLIELPAGETDKSKLYEHTRKNFLDFKNSVQDLVALSFTTAMQQYSGKQIEYYCQVRLVPEPISRATN